MPDIVASLSQVEWLLFADRWMQNGQINLKYAERKTEVVLPFTGRTLLFTSRIIWTSTLSMALR